MLVLAADSAVSSASAPALGWGTLALINAGLAELKRRGRMSWFLLSLLLGPIATFLIVIMEPGDRRTDAMYAPCCGALRSLGRRDHRAR